MSYSITIDEIVESWLTTRGVSDFSPFDQWRSAMSLQTLDKDAFAVRAGDISRDIFFIHSGLLRLFYTSAEGKERNKAFYGPGQVAGAVSAAITAKAATFDIQALEPSVLVRADFNQIYQHAYRNTDTSRVIIALLAEAFIRNEQREAMLLTLSAEQRYQWLLDKEPELVKSLPQFHIASYIGVDAVSLSRLKRKLKLGQ